jgi:hypothetical protein
VEHDGGWTLADAPLEQADAPYLAGAGLRWRHEAGDIQQS